MKQLTLYTIQLGVVTTAPPGYIRYAWDNPNGGVNIALEHTPGAVAIPRLFTMVSPKPSVDIADNVHIVCQIAQPGPSDPFGGLLSERLFSEFGQFVGLPSFLCEHSTTTPQPIAEVPTP
jgi:hypothetical protein